MYKWLHIIGVSRDNSEINMNMRLVSLAIHKERGNKCRSELFAILNYSIKTDFWIYLSSSRCKISHVRWVSRRRIVSSEINRRQQEIESVVEDNR